MTLTELRYVVAVAEARHFGQAAERCFVSQPSLSASVKNLEEELGVKLFERGKRGVFLTEAGEQIVAQARRALEEAERVKTVARQGRDPLKGVLRLGIIHTVAPYLLPDLVGALRRTAPEMPLDVEENTTANLDRMLKAGELDAVILALPYEGPGIETVPLYEETFRVAAPASHALARKKIHRGGGPGRGRAAAAAGRPLLPRPGARRLPRVFPAAGGRAPGQLAGNAAQHGGIGPGRHGAARDRAHAAPRQCAGEDGRILRPLPGAAHRARLAPRLSPARRAGKTGRRDPRPRPAGQAV